MGQGLIKILRDRNKAYAQYYRHVHSIMDSETGLFVMEWLPRQLAWGTLWTNGSGAVVEMFVSNIPGSAVHRYISEPDDIEDCLPKKVNATDRIIKSLKNFIAWAMLQRPADMEFCIDKDGVKISQYRPIPKTQHSRIENIQKYGRTDNCLPPYADFVLDGHEIEVRISKDSKKTVLAKKIIHADGHGTWVVPYKSEKDCDLFDVLEISSALLKTEKLPCIIATMVSTDIWGHLHAVAAEDPHISRLGFRYLNIH